MKKILFILIAILITPQAGYCTQAETMDLLAKKGFFENSQHSAYANPYIEIRKALFNHMKYANNYNIEGLKTLYADNYINADGLDKNIYFDLIKKTWDSYPDIKYTISIKNLEVNANNAVAQVVENAMATTNSQSGIIRQKGCLESTSNSVYYFEKINNKWLITSDHIICEKTMLRYGIAKNLKIELIAPNQIAADTEYTAALSIQAPKDSLIIASVGRENITYPQVLAEEVFRKMPDDCVLERVFKANNKNINEYAVASYGITKAEIKDGTQLKIYITGLGFAMSRVNVIPKNEFIKIAENEKETVKPQEQQEENGKCDKNEKTN